MMKLGFRYIWFKLTLVVGSLLGVLLLIQSVNTYYQVSRILVVGELQREARNQVNALGREAAQLGIRDPVEFVKPLEEMRQEAPGKIAWIKVTDMAAHTLAQAGNSVGPPLTTERLRQGFEGSAPTFEIRPTPAGRVFVTWLRLGPGRRPPAETARGEPNPPPVRGPGPRPGARWVEIALYTDSVSTVFRPLLTNLIVSSSAALGLVASMILMWIRFPNYLRGKQLEQQTELARKVQTDLLPPPNLTFQHLDFAAECIPAWQVGGDFYDVFTTGHGRIAIVLGDVSGKGLPASVVVGLLLGAVRASGWLGGATQHEESSARLSELLRTRTSLERFASLFWCYYEPETHLLRYVNAGHPAPMVVRRNGGGEELEIRRLEEGGPVLGVLQGAPYRQGAVEVCAGDLLVLYSDGVAEAEDGSGRQFGDERLVAAVRDNFARPATEIRDEILERVHAFLGTEQAQDDLTLVVARVQEGSSKARDVGL